jgi:hypothetical protein
MFLANASIAFILKYGKFNVHRSEMTMMATCLKLLTSYISCYNEEGNKMPK